MMKFTTRIAALAALAILFPAARPAAAQSDILLQLRSGSPVGDRVRVDSAGGFVALGSFGAGIIPATGAGSRTMWYPSKSSFRSGQVDSSNPTAWDDANNGFFSWAGGVNTVASGTFSFAFGQASQASGQFTVSLGSANVVSGTAGFSTGASNRCTGFTCVAMGFTTTASGQGSVAIGYRSTADADYAIALGHRASANGHMGSFTWADGSTTDSLESNANNSFQTRAAGGYRLYSNATLTTGVSITAGGSSWNVISDRNRKEQFRDVEGEEILSRIRRVPVTTWRYRDEADRAVRHIGPMAQDWHAAFGFNADDRTINMSDLDGVNLAAVKALDARTTELREENAALREEVDALRAENQRLRERQDELDRRLTRLEAAPEADLSVR
jgi:hypothetical protein